MNYDSLLVIYVLTTFRTETHKNKIFGHGYFWRHKILHFGRKGGKLLQTILKSIKSTAAIITEVLTMT